MYGHYQQLPPAYNPAAEPAAGSRVSISSVDSNRAEGEPIAPLLNATIGAQERYTPQSGRPARAPIPEQNPPVYRIGGRTPAVQQRPNDDPDCCNGCYPLEVNAFCHLAAACCHCFCECLKLLEHC